MNSLIRYFIFFGIILLFSFGIHIQFVTNSLFFLIQSYLINTLMASFALIILDYGLEKKKNNLANLYLLSVLIKLLAYFLFFHPKFKLDGNVNHKEFFIFFVPYALGLLSEIFLLAKRYK